MVESANYFTSSMTKPAKDTDTAELITCPVSVCRFLEHSLVGRIFSAEVSKVQI